MAKNYTKLIVAAAIFLTGKGIAQVSTYSEGFGGAGTSTFPSGWTSASSDWGVYVDDTNGGVIPTCNVAGSSANSIMAGADGSASVESSVSAPFSTIGYSSLTLQWNGYRLTGAPTLSVALSSDNVTYTNVSFTDVTDDNAWHALSTISIPPAFNGQATVYIKWSYQGSTSGNFFAIDDINVMGIPSPIFYWNGSGALTTLASWGTNTDGSGLNPTNFTGNNQIFNLVNNTSATLSSAWAIAGTGTKLNVGDGVTGINLNLNAALTFSGGAQAIVLNTSTLTLQSATFPAITDVVINSGSTINFAQSSAVSIWSATYSNLTISGASDKNVSGNPVINGILNLNGRNLAMTNSALQNLTLNGTITGSGALKTGNSRLTIGGTGAFGTINFVAGATSLSVNQFNVNRASSGTITLGSDLTALGTSVFQNGKIDLNGKNLTFSGAVTFPNTISNGCFIGSGASTLTIGGSGAITNSLFLDQTSASTKSLFDLSITRSGVSLTIGNGLNIVNSVNTPSSTIVSGGNITLKADATRSAMINKMSSGSVSGNITLETISATSGTTGWTNLSPSLNGLTVSSWDGQFPMSCSGCINDDNSAGGHFVSIQGWNEAASGGSEYVELIGSSALTLGKGFWVYLGTASGSTSAITTTNSGTIGQGTITTPVTVSAQTGDNLVSNPYPAPINWSLVAGDASNSNLDGSAIVYSPVGGQITLNGAGASTPGGFISGGIIPRGQGFYVHATSGGNVTFKEAHKATANTSANPILRSSTSASNEFRLSIAGPYAGYDEALFIFDNNATTNFDRLLDAYKMFSTPGYLGYPGVYSQYTSISSQMGNKSYAINALPLNGNGDLVIPILAKAMVAGTYTIAPMDIQNIPAGSCVTLKDKLLGVDHNLRTGAYVCTLSDTTKTARFELTVCRTSGPTGIQTISANNNQIFINQDQNGAYVKTSFEENTKATISAYNTMGQKLVADKEVEGKELTTYLDLGNVHSQVVIIKVTTAKESSVKKLFVN